MGLLEDVAVADLKFRLVLVPSVIVFLAVVTAAVSLLQSRGGLVVGVVLGLPVAAAVGYAIAKRVV